MVTPRVTVVPVEGASVMRVVCVVVIVMLGDWTIVLREVSVRVVEGRSVNDKVWRIVVVLDGASVIELVCIKVTVVLGDCTSVLKDVCRIVVLGASVKDI